MSSAGISRDQLRSIVERIERLEEEKAATATDIKEVYAEAKGNGFEPKIIRQVIRLRKQDTAERAEQEALLDVYLAALGMTPIERAIADADEGGAGDEDGAPSPPPSPTRGEGAAADRGKRNLKREVAGLGTPVPEEERAKGCRAAIVGTAIGMGVRV